MNNIYFIIISIIVLIYIIISIRKGNIGITTSFGWVIASIIMLLLSIFPYSIDWIALKIGITYPPALFLTLCVVFLVVLNFHFSKKIANLQEKLIDLAQEVSILKGEKNDKK